MEYTALIVAAGSGSRMGLGYNKVLYTFSNGETIIEKTVSIFRKDTRCTQIILVVSKDDREVFEKLFGEDVILVNGGAARQDSVYQGLQKVTNDHVLIHDGARPWLRMACIDRILMKLEEVDACLAMVPVKDTIKEVVDGKIVTTFRRSYLRQAQTPQAFSTKLITACYEEAITRGMEATDDAQMVELCGHTTVYEVEGDYENRKVTTPEDLNEHE